MFEDQIINYLNWAKQRGLKFAVPRSKVFKVGFEADAPLTQTESELVHKIAAAMELKQNEYFISTPENKEPALVTIFLGSTSAHLKRGEFTNLGEKRFGILTDHPSLMLKDPTKKRAVWNEMQIVMRHLN